MTPAHRSYLAAVVEGLRRLPSLYADPFKQAEPHAEAAFLIALLDLEPARKDLEPCYCPRKGGKPPRDPIAMLRSLVLMAALGNTSINAWAKRLRREPLLAVLAGFDPDDTPGVGTFYDFFYRIMDGRWEARCKHSRRPSDLFRGKNGRFRRNLDQEKAETKAASQAELARENETVVNNRVRKALSSLDRAIPDDCLSRIEAMLFKCAVVPSIEMGFLGGLGVLDISGDGSSLPSHANGNGRPLCQCHEQGNSDCDCDRTYSDPDAKWGWDSFKKVYYFGHRLHALVAKHGEVELPLHLMIEAANTPDVVMSVEAVTRLYKLMKIFLPGVELDHAIFDKGYDAIGFHKLIFKLGAKPVIALNEANFKPCDEHGVTRDEKGRPLCAASIPMRFHGFNKRQQVAVYNCPAKRPARKGGKLHIAHYPEECPLGLICEPESKMGPLVYLRPEDDPRLNPAVPRDSKEYKEAMAKRTSTERFNSFVKEAGGLGKSPYRRRNIFLIVTLCHALRRHAMVWAKKRFGDTQPDSFDGFVSMLEGVLEDQQAEAEAA